MRSICWLERLALLIPIVVCDPSVVSGQAASDSLVSTVTRDIRGALRGIEAAQTEYFHNHNTYGKRIATAGADALPIRLPRGLRVKFLFVSSSGYAVRVWSTQAVRMSCVVWAGSVPPKILRAVGDSSGRNREVISCSGP
jgi:hypothetical protein